VSPVYGILNLTVSHDDTPLRADDMHGKRTIFVWQQHIEPL